MPNLVGYLNRTPIFEWDVVKCSFENKCKKDMCFEEVGVRVQNMVTILCCLLRR
jgi:hypothetical protein